MAPFTGTNDRRISAASLARFQWLARLVHHMATEND